jgi:hypothetical protein
LLELTASEIEQMEAKLYGPIPTVTPDDALRLINDWRKHRWAISHLIKLFRPSADGRYVSADGMRSDTFATIKKSVGL